MFQVLSGCVPVHPVPRNPAAFLCFPLYLLHLKNANTVGGQNMTVYEKPPLLYFIFQINPFFRTFR